MPDIAPATITPTTAQLLEAALLARVIADSTLLKDLAGMPMSAALAFALDWVGAVQHYGSSYPFDIALGHEFGTLVRDREVTPTFADEVMALAWLTTESPALARAA